MGTHPRDPHHRIEVLSEQHDVYVLVDGRIVAESTSPAVMLETGNPARYYLPPEDVRMDLLAQRDLRTTCPYKGQATYWDAVIEGERIPAVAWSYPEPLPEVETVRGFVCFFQERPEITLEVDGAAPEADPTPWAGTGWLEGRRVAQPERA